LWWRTGVDGEVALDGGFEALEVFFQDGCLLTIGNGTDRKLLGAPLLQQNPSVGFGVADPFCTTARAYQEKLPVDFEQVDRCRIYPAAFASTHL